MVWYLLKNFGVPFFALPGYFGDPMQSLVIKLLHLFNSLHELGEVLKLGPLVVDRVNRRIDFDGFFNAFHKSS